MDNEENAIILTKDTFGALCRTCMSKTNTLHEISTTALGNLLLKDLLFTAISELEDNELPQQICELCIVKLCDIHSFKESCSNSDSVLQKVLKWGLGVINGEHIIELQPELVFVAVDRDPCPECPSRMNLTYSLKRALLLTGKTTHLCAYCGKSSVIEYKGQLKDALPESMDDFDIKPIIVTKESFSQRCRTCLTEADVMYQVFDISFQSVPIRDLLIDCISLKVEEDDDMPQNICALCTTRLCENYIFKKNCLEYHSLLQQALQCDIRIVKKEPEEEDEIYLNGIRSDIEFGFESDTSDEYGKKKQNDDQCKLACSVCGKVIARQSYWRHKQLHSKNKTPYKCSKCTASFSLHCNLKRHIMIHTGERPHLCDHCGKGFIQANSLIEHKRIHTGEKPYKCKRCHKKWAQYSSYKSHINKPNCSGMIKRGLDKFECSQCCGIFLSKDALRVHKCDDTSLICRICGRDFITRNALKIHIRAHNGPKFYICSICNENFSSRLLFTRHMSRHRRTEHICKECGKGFSNYSGLWSHRRIHSGEQPYACTICPRAFSQTGSLKSHMLIHTGEKPYSCEICNKTFTQPNHLKYHLRTHSGEKPYLCKYCGKAFSLNGTLTVHMRIHTGETPYVCNTCQKGFYDSSSLKKHFKKHEEEKNHLNSNNRKVMYRVILPIKQEKIET